MHQFSDMPTRFVVSGTHVIRGIEDAYLLSGFRGRRQHFDTYLIPKSRFRINVVSRTIIRGIEDAKFGVSRTEFRGFEDASRKIGL
jgi:hypothetical protein